jgi:hypothetical protein
LGDDAGRADDRVVGVDAERGEEDVHGVAQPAGETDLTAEQLGHESIKKEVDGQLTDIALVW